MQESIEMKTVELVFFDAGGGHRSAANALCEVVKQSGRPWEMKMMNLQELLDQMDIFRKLTGYRLQDLYNLMLRKGWTLGSPWLMKGMHAVIWSLHGKQVKLLSEYWRKSQPDIVVSVIPNFNRAIFDAIERVMPHVPMVTILTDMADYPPHFWIENQKQFFICGTARAHQQALEIGNSPDRLFRASGMILNPRYYEPIDVNRGPERAALGLDPELPTALMMFGGEGSPKMLDIARALDASEMKLQVIAICGKSKKLETAMRAMKSRIPMHVEGFTREVPRFMRLADFFVGKPGPGSISEAVAMGLPVIIERNYWTLPQERFNAEWVEQQGVGISLHSFRHQITDAVRKMIDPEKRCEFVKRVSEQRNRAVFEIPEILEKLLAANEHASRQG